MSTVVDKLREQLGAAAGQFLLSLFSRSVFTRTTRGRRLGGWRKSRRRQRSSSASGGVQRLRGVLCMTRRKALTKDVANGRESVVGLVSGNVVNV